MAFCKEYNAQTAKMAGDVVPVEITVYEVREQGCPSAVFEEGYTRIVHVQYKQASEY